MRGAVKNYVFGQRKLTKPSLLFEFEDSIVDSIGAINTSYNNISLTEFGDGKVGRAINFTANQSGIRRSSMSGVPHPYVPGVGDLPFSISVWIKKTSTNGSGANFIYGLMGAGSLSNAFILGIRQDGEVVCAKFSGANARRVLSDNVIPMGYWTLIQYVDGGVGNERIFIDNVESSLTITDDGYTTMANQKPYGPGISSHSQFNASGDTLIGWFDQLAYWNNYELSEKEREHIWNEGNGRRIF